MAERTGFEPATPGVTGRYSNQLNYRSPWWALLGSNQCPLACKASALPTELNAPYSERDGYLNVSETTVKDFMTSVRVRIHSKLSTYQQG